MRHLKTSKIEAALARIGLFRQGGNNYKYLKEKASQIITCNECVIPMEFPVPDLTDYKDKDGGLQRFRKIAVIDRRSNTSFCRRQDVVLSIVTRSEAGRQNNGCHVPNT
jgi:hypothetical protein